MGRRDPSEIIPIGWFGAHETFIIIINVGNSFPGIFDESEIQKNNNLSQCKDLINVMCWIYCII